MTRTGGRGTLIGRGVPAGRGTLIGRGVPAGRDTPVGGTCALG